MKGNGNVGKRNRKEEKENNEWKEKEREKKSLKRRKEKKRKFFPILKKNGLLEFFFRLSPKNLPTL